MARQTSQKPLIGLIADYEHTNKDRIIHRDRYIINKVYVDAIEKAGGVPIVVPYLEKPSTLITQLDGLVLIGGDFDIPPSFYGAKASPKLNQINRERSGFEYESLKIALKQKLPILGICGGMQLINVAFGGTLIQDIPSHCPGNSTHDHPTPGRASYHGCKIEKDSHLYRMLKCTSLKVNSSHHQAIDKVGKGLIIVARANDDIIEAIEHPAYDFLLGVQWHPERMPNKKEQMCIFKHFIKHANH